MAVIFRRKSNSDVGSSHLYIVATIPAVRSTDTVRW